MYTPKVTILMTVRNGERFIENAVQSLLDQTFSDFELIIVDDGSTDDSMKIVNEFNDTRIITIFTSGIGRTPALNKGLATSNGEYVAVLDADDISLPERLKKQVDFLDTNPHTAMVGTACIFIDEKGRETERFSPPTSFSEIRMAMPIYNPFAHSSVMYRRQMALKAGGYPSEFAYAQDFALYLLLTLTHELANLPDFLTKIRRHDRQMTQTKEFSNDYLHDGGILLAKARRMPGLPMDVIVRGRKINAWMDREYVWRLCDRREWRKAAHYVFDRFTLEPFEPETWNLVGLLLKKRPTKVH